MSLRLFIGLDLPLVTQQQLAPLCVGLRDGRWIEPDNLHITLAFIGEMDEAQAEDLHEVLQGVRVDPFELYLSAMGLFDYRGQPKQLWAGVRGDLDALHGLHRRLLTQIESVGLKPERRKYLPHVTLCRFRKETPATHVQSFIEGNNRFESDPFVVTRFCLFQSHLTRHGADYELLSDYGR